MTAEKLDSKKGEAWYSSVGLTYVYGRVPSLLLKAKQCNFRFIGGESNGKYRFITGLYGLTFMPRE